MPEVSTGSLTWAVLSGPAEYVNGLITRKLGLEVHISSFLKRTAITLTSNYGDRIHLTIANHQIILDGWATSLVQGMLD